MSTQIKKNGNWVTVAGGTRMWVGTKAALQAALDAGELVDGTAVMVTDDYEEGVESIPVTVNSNFIIQESTNCKKTGRLVILNFRGHMNNVALSTDVNNATLLGSIPAAYAPKSVVSSMIQGWDGTLKKTALTVDANGNIISYGEVSTNNQFMWGQVSWILED